MSFKPRDLTELDKKFKDLIGEKRDRQLAPSKVWLAGDIKNPATWEIVTKTEFHQPLQAMFASAPEDLLYRVIEICQAELSRRPGSKK